jgi:excinuclease ABC subunit C
MERFREHGEARISLTREDLELLPDQPGVYIFTDEDDRIIYVGKAASLKKRVRSYFPGTEPDNPRLAQLRKRISHIDYIITGNEAEALLLEGNLIKRYRPDFNIELKDDKSYPYIAITLSESYPRVTFMRGTRKKGTLYFGPYAHAGAARETIETLRRAFAFRSCRGGQPGKRSGSPCLDYHINLCPGPCLGKITPQEYMRNITKVREFLEGRQEKIIKELKQKMREEASREEYEKAARTRDRVQALERIMERQSVDSANEGDMDVIGLAADELDACITVLFVRKGKLLSKREFIFPRLPEAGEEGLVEGFIERFYETAPSIPREILSPVKLSPERSELLAFWVESKRGRRVRVKCPQRGVKLQLVHRASENAHSYLEMNKLKRASDLNWISEVTDTLMRELGLGKVPYRIECFDISNLGACEVAGSMVVFEGGFPLKKDYRKFSLRTGASDDVSRMAEVLKRRLSHLSSSPLLRGDATVGESLAVKLTSFQKKPDLILIDGGKAQLNAVLRAMEEMGIEDIEVMALAKRLEGIYLKGVSEPVVLSRDSKALYLLQRVRDEAHRFALEYHRNLREQRSRSSILDRVPGIGAKRKRYLLERYGSVERLRKVGREELCSLEFLDRRTAENLYRTLHEEEPGGDL